jgi:hypothetical protein
MQVRRSLRLPKQAPPLHTFRCRRRIGMMKLKPILLAILFILMIGLAGCVEGPGYYGSYGYPSYGYYNGAGFYPGGRFDRDRFYGRGFSPYRFGGAGFHNGPVFAHAGGFRGGFGGGQFGGGGGRR